MKRIIHLLFKVSMIVCMVVGNIQYVNAKNLTLSVKYPDGYSTGRMIYASGAGEVCEDGKDHRLFTVGGNERFLSVFYLNGEVVYCVQPYAQTKSGYTYSEMPMDDTAISYPLRDYLELASYFGYGYNNDYSMLTCIATQDAIWEYQGASVGSITPELRERINLIKQRVENYLSKKKPSFDGNSYVFEGVGEENAIYLEDKNQVVQDWLLTSLSEGLHYEKENNTIKVWADQPFFDEKSIEYNLYDPNDKRVSGNSLLFINPNNAQKLASFADPVKREASVRFTMVNGDFEITKYMNSNSQGTGIQSFEENAQFIVMKKEYVDRYGSVENAYKYRDLFSEYEYDILTTNAQGYAKSKKLGKGEYWIVQIKGADDSVLLDEWIEFIVEDANQETLSYTFTNVRYSSKIKISKVDEAGNPILKNPATFKIKDAKGNFVIKEIDGIQVSEFSTDVNGEILLPFKLDAGAYYLVEQKAPAGFVLSEEEIAFIITNTGDILYDEKEEPYVFVQMKNEKRKAKVVVHKSFENPEYLVGDKVQFELYANMDIYDPGNHSLVYAKNQKIGTYTLPSNGILSISDLPMGYDNASYRLKEIQTYDNYELDANEYVFNFSANNPYEKEIVLTQSMENKLIRIKTYARDALDDDKIIPALKEVEIKDQVMYEGLEVGKEYVCKGKIMDVLHHTSLKDKEGNEIIAEVRFIPTSTSGTIDMSYVFDASSLKNGSLVVFTQLFNSKNELLCTHEDWENEDQSIQIIPTYDFEIHKIDKESQNLILDSFTFTIYEDEACSKVLYELESSNQSGILPMYDLLEGVYYIKESKAPKGYEIKDDYIKLEIIDQQVFVDDVKMEDSDIYVLNVENKKIKIVQTGAAQQGKRSALLTFTFFLSSFFILLGRKNKDTCKKSNY